MHACVYSCSVVSNSLWPHGLQPARLLCPWNYPGKNTEVGSHFLLQGIFPTQRSNPHILGLLLWQAGSLPLSHLGPTLMISSAKTLFPNKIIFTVLELGLQYLLGGQDGPNLTHNSSWIITLLLCDTFLIFWMHSISVMSAPRETKSPLECTDLFGEKTGWSFMMIKKWSFLFCHACADACMHPSLLG